MSPFHFGVTLFLIVAAPVFALDAATLPQWEAEKQTLRADWLKFLGKHAEYRTFEQPARLVRYDVLDEETADGVKRLKIRYTTEPGQKVEAFLLVPTGLERSEKRPAAVVFHTTSPDAHRQAAGVSGEPAKAFGLRLAKRRYVVVCPQNFLWPEVGNFDPVKADEYLKRNPDSRGMSRMLLDGQIAVDLLSGHENVDPARIGCLGHSLGAKEALYLAAFDERIACTVSSEGGLGIGQSNWDAPWYLGKDASRPDFPLDHAGLLALVAPRPFLLLGGGASDGVESRPAFEEAASVYGLYDAAKNLDFFLHEKGHAVPPEAETEIDRWMDTFLRPERDRCTTP